MVLSPISTTGMTLDDLPRLRDEAREQIQRAANQLRAELGLESSETVLSRDTVDAI